MTRVIPSHEHLNGVERVLRDEIATVEATRSIEREANMADRLERVEGALKNVTFCAENTLGALTLKQGVEVVEPALKVRDPEALASMRILVMAVRAAREVLGE